MDPLSIIFGTQHASIAGIRIDACVSETHANKCIATRYAVEDKNKITDHVQMEPFELELDCVISDSPVTFSYLDAITGIARTVSSMFGGQTISAEAYDKLRELQKTRKPFRVITGLKVYDNMILEDFTPTRTSETGNCIAFKAKLTQIEYAIAKTTDIGEASEEVSNMAESTSDLGTQSAESLENGSSLLTSGADALFSAFAAVA